MKIVVLGGMGYIGSALCELYRKQSGDQIVLVDNRMIPERIAALPPHVSYVQADIADLDYMRHVTADADIVHFLAAQVEAEMSVHREEAVWRDNFELPKSVIEIIPSSARVLWASSGNVFGGVNEAEKYMDLDETDTPRPKYPYAETKFAMEQFLHQHNGQHTIVRFGTNYGYAPGIRFNLVTNIFARKAILGESLTIHGAGLNYRPTCCVNDCARALDFLARRQDTNRETYHVVNESLQIKDLARTVIDSVGSDSELNFVAKEVPFSAYALSNAKIRGLGFEFAWTIETAVRDLKEKLHAMRRKDA